MLVTFKPTSPTCKLLKYGSGRTLCLLSNIAPLGIKSRAKAQRD